ncbi:MAG: hypothetical protein RJB66_230 [Pseudomonadota bacterium]|jgi:protein PhnA
MSESMVCPKCSSTHVYADASLWICPECGNEWSQFVAESSTADSVVDDGLIRDANGNVLSDGDAVIVIKDLKVKGSSLVVKGGTKVKNIRLTDGGDGHDIACKIDGIGAMNLKSEFVRKA